MWGFFVMRPPVKYALVFFSLFAIGKIILFQMGLQQQQYQMVILANLLFVLLAVFFALREITKTRGPEGVSFLADVKLGLQTAALYALLTASFVYVYYKWIDVEFLNSMQEHLITQVETAIENESIPKGTTKHQFLEDSARQAEMIYSPGSQFTITMIGLIMMGFIYSFFLTFLNRKVLSRFRQ